MAVIEPKPDRLEIEITFNRPKNGQELLDLAKAFGYLADRTGVADSEIAIDDHEYDDTKQVASWNAEGLG
jgi:hypothetical protein